MGFLIGKRSRMRGSRQGGSVTEQKAVPEIPEDLKRMHKLYSDPTADVHCGNLTVLYLIERIAALTAENTRLREQVGREADPPPQHAFEVRIVIGGDDWEYVLRVLEELSQHIPMHGPDCGLSSGGAGGSHSVDIAKRDVSPEQFHDELQAWMERRRARITPPASEHSLLEHIEHVADSTRSLPDWKKGSPTNERTPPASEKEGRDGKGV